MKKNVFKGRKRKFLTLGISILSIVLIASTLSFLSTGDGLNFWDSMEASSIEDFDVNNDGVYDRIDFDMIAEHYGEVGDPGWIPEDVNEDGEIDIYDLSLVSAYINGDNPPGPLSLGGGVNYLNVTPPTQFVGTTDSFSVDVHLDPGEPIIAVQIDLSFDATLLQCDSVSNGNSGTWGFFQSGSIDNTNGEISGACVANMGGTVTSPIDCFVIAFTAQNIDGTSPLDIHNVGMSNVTGFAIPSGSIAVDNGSATVDGTDPTLDSAIFTDDGYAPNWYDQGSDTHATIQVSWTEAHVDEVEITVTGIGTYTDISAVSDGSYAVSYSITDLVGNADSSVGGTDDAPLKLDNTGPSTPTSVECRPDGYSDTGEWDDDTEIYVTWSGESDAGCGVEDYYMEYDNAAPAEEAAGGDQQDTDTGAESDSATFYVRGKDNLGNWGGSSSDTIGIDLTAKRHRCYLWMGKYHLRCNRCSKWCR